MSRDPRLFLEDIQACASRVAAYTEGLTQSDFEANTLVYDAVLRNLEIIGEACKRLPAEMKGQAPGIPWRMIGGFRDYLAHAYFGVDNDTVWGIVVEELPSLTAAVERMRAGLLNIEETNSST